MKTKPYQPLFILCFFFLIILMMGCQIAGRDELPTPISSGMVQTETPIPTSPSSKTPLTTRTSTSAPIGTVEPTLEPASTSTATRVPGATRISSIDGMVLVYIPARDFQMGSIDADTGADYDEIPQHIVALDAYWMDRTVVTNAMYAHFLNHMGNQTEGRTTWLDAGDEDALIFQRDGIWQPLQGYENHPAIEVTWFGAQAYCQWVGRRLPTEAEWEKAARDPSKGPEVGRIYPWGDEINCDKAHYANCVGSLQPADSKPAGASPYGVLGLSGNTWEWVADWYADDYYSISPMENPKGPFERETRVLRGGSWEYDWKHLRAANRRHNGPAVSLHDYGFRCVLGDELP